MKNKSESRPFMQQLNSTVPRQTGTALHISHDASHTSLLLFPANFKVKDSPHNKSLLLSSNSAS